MEQFKPNERYMTFHPNDIKEIEKKILKNYTFNKEQVSFIHFLDSGLIEAGPGSGKTTVLSAKIALLIQKLDRSNSQQGICAITHTNSAVGEIKRALQYLGYESVPHPHFVGTIHEFFNIFGTNFARQFSYVSKAIDWVDGHQQHDSLKRYFIDKGYTWMSSNNPSFKKNSYNICNDLLNAHILFNKKDEEPSLLFMNYRMTLDKYKKNFIGYKKKEWEQGNLIYDDTFYFAQKVYFNHPQIQDLLKKRFKFFFVDEYQDLSPAALSLLVDTFQNPEICLQLIGDRNQHISYNNPQPSISRLIKYNLNVTNRFGIEIAQPLNRLIDGGLKPAIADKSLKSKLYIYKSKENILDEITSYFNNLHSRNTVALISKKKHSNILQNREVDKIERIGENSTKKVLDIVYRIISKKTGLTVQSCKQKTKNEYINSMVYLRKVLIHFFKEPADIDESLLTNTINKVLEEFECASSITKKNKQIIKIIDLIKATEKKHSYLIPIYTVHTAKGLTFNNVVYYLQQGDVNEKEFLKIYKKEIIDNNINQRVNYVAMSRPEKELIIALSKNTYEQLDEELIERLGEDFLICEESKNSLTKSSV